MSETLLLSIEITALGMGLVFAAIVLLWGLMSVLTALHLEKPEVALPETDLKARAAAAAVAVALAQQEASSTRPLPEPPTPIISAWQLGMRTRQMYEKGELTRR